MRRRDQGTPAGLTAVVAGSEAGGRAEAGHVDEQLVAVIAALALAEREHLRELPAERVGEPLGELERGPMVAVLDPGDRGLGPADLLGEFFSRQARSLPGCSQTLGMRAG